jgi:hypothetical protein
MNSFLKFEVIIYFSIIYYVEYCDMSGWNHSEFYIYIYIYIAYDNHDDFQHV